MSLDRCDDRLNSQRPPRTERLIGGGPRFRTTRHWVAMLAICLSAFFSVGFQELAGQDSPQVENPGFDAAQDWLRGWTVEIGATQGAAMPVSEVRRGDEGGLELAGNGQTRAWHLVRQRIDVQPGQSLRFFCEARATGIRREGAQFDNCWVGIRWVRQGTFGRPQVEFVRDSEWAGHEMLLQVPSDVDEMDVACFLSKTGVLGIRRMTVETTSAADSFELLVGQMDRYYSYFDHKQIDWPALVAKYREAATEAKSAAAFERTVLPMLAELRDGHVWVERDGKPVSEYRVDWQPNDDFRLIDAALENPREIGRVGVLGMAPGGIGYVRVNSVQVSANEWESLLTQVKSLDAPRGMVVDLRRNRGGNEQLGLALASYFCDEPVVYARQRFRRNQQHDLFDEVERPALQPARGKRYPGPVICLIGPGCVSSGEGMALMFDALPRATLIGQPTRGSSGNPQPVVLPNGVKIWFSRWVALDAEGQVIEDRGVEPDILVPHANGDPAWAEALRRLSRNP